MTVESSTQYVAYETDGVTLAYAIPFYFLDGSHIYAQFIASDSSEGVTQLMNGTDFTVTGAGNEDGGELVLAVAKASGFTLYIDRQVPVTQETAYQQNSAFPAKTTETALDKLTMIAQQLTAQFGRAIRYPVNEYATDGTLPVKAQRASMILGFDSGGAQTLLPIPAAVGAGDLRNEYWADGVDYTAGVSTSVTLSRSYGTKANLGILMMSGIGQSPHTYALSGTTLTFTDSTGNPVPIPDGIEEIWCVGGTTLSLNAPATGSVDDDSLAAGSKVYNRANDEISVMDFSGADPTGVQDSLAAFNAAAAESSSSGKTVYVPGGAWKLSDQPTIGASSWRLSPNASFSGTWPYFFRGFYTNINVAPFGDGANIGRFPDRTMFGTATKYDGKNTPVAKDWINTLYPDLSGVSAFGYLLTNAQMGVGAPLGELAITAYGRTSDSGAAGNGVIGVSSVVVNDNTVGVGSTSWNYYATAVRGVGATGPSTLGMEIDITNLGNEVDIYPNFMFPNGVSAALWLAAGGELPNQSTARTYNKVSAAIGIFANQPGAYPNCAFDKGIVFGKGGISSQVAMALPENYGITWFNDGDAVTSAILSSATLSDSAHIQKLQFSDAGALFTDGSGNPQFRVANGVSNGANYLMAQAAVSGQPASLSAQGSDTDIVLALTPKGLGTLQFGTYTASAVAQTGYITIRDSGGSIRRLLVG